jgi:hypothetical protein
MSSPALEALLARLYTDETALAAFLAAPHEVALAAGLDAATVTELAAVDRGDLIAAAHSFRATRAKRFNARKPSRLARWHALLTRCESWLARR